MNDNLIIDGKEFRSRLFIGTGKHKSLEDLENYITSSESEMITVAIRRLDLDDNQSNDLLSFLIEKKLNILPNTAGCKNIDEIILTCELSRELINTNWVKLEAIKDPKYLLPDPMMTIIAAEKLIKNGFKVLPYINSDPALAKNLEEIGCSTECH